MAGDSPSPVPARTRNAIFSSTISHPPTPFAPEEGESRPSTRGLFIQHGAHSFIQLVCSTDWGRKAERGSEGGERETTSSKVWLGYGVPRPLCSLLERPLRPYPPTPAFVGTSHSLWPLALHRWMLLTLFLSSPSSSCAGFRGERSGK